MKPLEMKHPESIHPRMIAPCGMNCSLCIGYLREKNRCLGCNYDDANKPRYCVTCRIKLCSEKGGLPQTFCSECAKFPCARLRQLDKRYRTRYGMSMIENLGIIRDLGLKGFVTREKTRWKCPQCGAIVCVHRRECIYCGQARKSLPSQ